MSCAYSEIKPSALARAAHATFFAHMPRWSLASLRPADMFVNIHVVQKLKKINQGKGKWNRISILNITLKMCFNYILHVEGRGK